MLLGFLLQHDLMNPDLQLVLVGAGDCPKALLAAAAARGISVSFGYGLTETSSGVAISVPPAYRVNPVSHTEADCNSDAAMAQGASECGQSFDPYALEICPENTVTLAADGEILVTGESCMMKGYYKEPEDTAAVLRNGVLYTGDLGRWDDNGRLHIIGRKKEILVLHDGTKLFLPEYEARIAVVLPGRDFAVLERDGRPVLLLVDPEAASAEPGSPAADKARALVLGAIRPIMASLPRGQQISAVLFTGKTLPRTATGKIKRWELSRC
jgi:long-subunit acyl-CoA synthetase (AMP-forming)